jgi:hypothetical protein
MGKIMKTKIKVTTETMQNRIFSVVELNNLIYATEKVIKKKLQRPKKDIQNKKASFVVNFAKKKTDTD